MEETSVSMIGLAITTVSTMVAAVWFLSVRIGALRVDIETLAGKIDREVASIGGRVDSAMAKSEGKFGAIDGQLQGLIEQTTVSHQARGKLWEIINAIRERLAALEQAVGNKK